LITRVEKNAQVLYAHVGTGNFNEDTARLYCDYSLLTSDKKITEEVERLFEFYNDNYKAGTYKHLIVSPFFSRKRYVHLINKEIEQAKHGKEASIFLKMNSITDEEMIRKLYEASQAGVKIRMIVRGICSLVPGIKGVSDNIEVISIIDRFLEHARVFVFNNGGETKVYLSSADWMTRNIDHRSEVGVPIFDEAIQKQLIDMLEIQWSDQLKARIINGVQDNSYRITKGKNKIRSQEEIYRYLQQQLPAVTK
jgi:polyphosphate kinase